MTNQPGYQPGPASAGGPLNPSDEKLWASLAHFGNIIGFLPALLIFLILKDRSEKVRTESKEALNWIITVTIVIVVLEVISSVVGAIGAMSPGGTGLLTVLVGFLIGLVIFAVVIVNIVFSIIGGVRVNQGGSYRYPFGLRLIK